MFKHSRFSTPGIEKARINNLTNKRSNCHTSTYFCWKCVSVESSLYIEKKLAKLVLFFVFEKPSAPTTNPTTSLVYLECTFHTYRYTNIYVTPVKMII